MTLFTNNAVTHSKTGPALSETGDDAVHQLIPKIGISTRFSRRTDCGRKILSIKASSFAGAKYAAGQAAADAGCQRRAPRYQASDAPRWPEYQASDALRRPGYRASDALRLRYGVVAHDCTSHGTEIRFTSLATYPSQSIHESLHRDAHEACNSVVARHAISLLKGTFCVCVRERERERE